MSEDADRIEARAASLREGANAAAGFVRNLYFTFLLLGAYLAVIIGSTTDLQLLRVAPVTLPVLGAELPIVAFYAVAPWLFLLFHFNLLLQLYLLSRRLHLLDAVVAGLPEATRVEQQALLFPFVFSHMLIGRQYGGFTHWLFKLMVWITVVLLPLVLLLWAELRFLPYHDAAATAWARAAVVVDLLLLWVFWPMIVTPPGRSTAGWWRAVGAGALPRRLRRRAPRPAGAPGTRYFLPMAATTVVVLLLSHAAAVLPEGPAERWMARHLPEALLHADSARPGQRTFALTHWLFDAPEAPLHRNLRLAGQVLTANELPPGLAGALKSGEEEPHARALSEVAGIGLAGRDLRFADLRDTVLPKADLRGANLESADLRRADLHGADLRPLEVPHAGLCSGPKQALDLDTQARIDASGLTLTPDRETPLCRTSLARARLSEARLTAARMPYVRLRAARLQAARLDGASLFGADLRETRMGGARLDGAMLAEADLRRAGLEKARLRDADLRDAALGGANLREADLSGADLSGDAQGLAGWEVDGAILDRTMLPPGAPLAGARLRSLRGAVLAQADLRRADLAGARMALADLTRARLTGATLSRGDLRGACLLATDLRGANLQQAALQGAFASGDLSGADLAMAEINGLVLHGARLDLADLRRPGLRPIDAGERDALEALAQAAPARCGSGLAARLDAARTRHPPAASFRMAAAERPMLCDRGMDERLEGALRGRCLAADGIDEYADRLARLGCEDPDVAYGLARRASLWQDYTWNVTFFGRRGAEPGPLGQRLAAALADPRCAGAAVLGEELREELSEIRANR